MLLGLSRLHCVGYLNAWLARPMIDKERKGLKPALTVSPVVQTDVILASCLNMANRKLVERTI